MTTSDLILNIEMNGLTIQTLAYALECSTDELEQWRRGEKEPPNEIKEKLESIFAYFQISLN